MAAANSINKMKVVGAPALGIYSVAENELRRLTKRAAFYFRNATFCKQPRATLASVTEFLEDLEPRLAVCKRSWGACALLSRIATNAVEYRAHMAGKAQSASTPSAPAAALPAAQAAALPVPPPASLPLLPAPPVGSDVRAGARAIGAHATAPTPALAFFASI